MPKKIFAIVLLVGMLVLFVACSDDSRYGEETDWDAVLEPTSLTVRTEYDEYLVDVDFIRLIWNNPTGEILYIGTGEGRFVLEKLINNVWRYVDFEGSFTYGIDAVLANDSTWQEIPIAQNFIPTLSAGTYRIIKDGVISNTFTLTN